MNIKKAIQKDKEWTDKILTKPQQIILYTIIVALGMSFLIVYILRMEGLL